MSRRLLLYGATGFSGGAIAERLVARGWAPILAGRDEAKLRPLAARLGLRARAFALHDAEGMAKALGGVDLVLNAAGPYRDTAAPLIAGCIAAGADYLDLSGEWPVFVGAMARDAEARATGVMLAPGAGVAIAATDSLLAQAAAAIPAAVRLRIAISRPHMLSRGSVRTMAALADASALVRRQGRLETVPAGGLARDFDFGTGRRRAVAFSWPDVVTAPFTTGVPDIEAYFECDWGVRAGYRLAAAASGVLRSRGLGAALSRAADVWPDRPSRESLAQAGYVLVAEAEDRWRRTLTLRLRLGDGYSSSLDLVEAMLARVLAGERQAGFQTPGALFGSGLLADIGVGAAEPAAA